MSIEKKSSTEIRSAFEAFDAKKGQSSLTAVQLKEAEFRLAGPHVVRLPKGSAPYRESLSPFQFTARKLVGRRFIDYSNPNLETSLEQARMAIRPEDYWAYVFFSTIMALVAGIAAFVVLGLLFAILKVNLFIVPVLIVVLLPVLAFLITSGSPKRKAKGRKRNIEKRISFAMSFISAMSSANVNIDVIFKELSKQKIYGEIQREAQWITRDIELMGKDILTALKDAANRSPSPKWQDFLQGVVTTSASGGQLKPFFLMKADQFNKDRRIQEKSLMETLGMLAETFVTVVVAAPLFLIVMMSLMATVNASSGNFIILMLYVIVLVMIPMSQLGFIVLISSMVEEV
ncbi:MAG TPA: type II secretion system F family protein [Candidatus Thermoplasmatota archaeon]|nr:type II secretion system F family protein [Candidatus Thermoplasmatota archaeon]